MRAWITGGLIGLMGLGATTAAEGVEDEDARLSALFASYLDDAFRDEPLMATRLGDHRFDDQLDDLSAEARAGQRRARPQDPGRPAEARSTRRSSRATGRSTSRSSATTSSARSGWPRHFRPFEDDPRIYGDYLTESVYLLLTQSTLPKDDEPQERPGADGEGPRGRRRSARQTIRQPAAGQGRDGHPADRGGDRASTRTSSSPSPASRRARGSSAEQGRRRSSRRLEEHLAFLEDEVLPRSTDDLADRPGAVRQEARPGARRRALGRRGAGGGRVARRPGSSARWP